MQELMKNQADQEERENEQAGRGMEWDRNIHGPRGIGGWLIVVLIGMIISMFLVAKQLFGKTLPALFTDSEVVRIETWWFREIYDAEWTTILTFDAVFEGLTIFYCCYVIIEFLREKPIVPRLMIIFYSMNLLGIIIETCLLLTTVEAVREEIIASYWSVGVALGVCLVWIPYFKMSARVENTFLNNWKSY
ncbi:hypothetical protein DCC85_05300 [Paenibacillus sp. CAA11]|uniref:DUF2569 domain-containing protein n=1 Tax=Paenibacillus sp. CAA11 TaxID=1532905 RepID=UPI000D398790|nr:DUF2569 domain-containing protein [Paenibacillus sp. CAA11]AWB43692.1 hypothetical protein DCC85_05300 [Paenibacillus sp. CAA11]